jgi:hypothetical protein
MRVAALTSAHYEKLSQQNQQYLSNLIVTIDFEWNVRDSNGNLVTDKDGNYKRKSDKQIDDELN